jgi:hypothetical protein
MITRLAVSKPRLGLWNHFVVAKEMGIYTHLQTVHRIAGPFAVTLAYLVR